MKLNKFFLEHCKANKFEINKNQLEVIENLENFYKENYSSKLFGKLFNRTKKFGFYLVGDVGVGKTMLLNFFFDQIKERKIRLHFNEFMINFHDFIFQMKDKENAIEKFVKDLNKKTKILYFDEFQVNNIVDAMILGKLFKKIFEEKILVLFSSNIKINDLYKDGLQREQFLPFIKILHDYCYEKELLIDEDYRTNSNQQQRFITLIDILYEKKIPIMITSEKALDKIGTSSDISNTFKRTISRLHELTSLSFQSK